MALVTIQNTLTDPTGAPIVGTYVYVTLVTGGQGPGYLPGSDLTYDASVKTDNNGNWSLALTPNSAIQPANTYYKVVENGYPSNIVVPPSGGPYSISQVLQSPPPSPASLAIASSVVQAKGDLIVGLGAGSVTNLPVGSASLPLVANPSVADGMQWGGRQVVPAVNLTDAATILTDASLGNYFRVTLNVAGATRQLGNPTNLVDGQDLMYEIIQDNSGSRAMTLGSIFGLGTDVNSVTLTTTPNKRDFLYGRYNSLANKIYLLRFVRGY